MKSANRTILVASMGTSSPAVLTETVFEKELT